MPKVKKYTKEQLIEIMKKASLNGRLSKLGLDGNPNLPGAMTVIRYFGSWSNALSLAGLRSGRHTGRPPIIKNDYITKHTIMGMLSKNYKPFDNWSGYIKNRKEVVLFSDSNHIISKYLDYDRINLNYVEKQDKVIKGYKNTSSYSSVNIKSKLDSKFFKLSGKNFSEFRETQNKYDKIIEVRKNCDINTIINFIDKWNKDRGKEKYGWQLHSGYDKTFFNKFYEKEKHNFYSNFFFIDNNLVGYSVVSRKADGNEYKYIIRKCDVSNRNLTLYIDLYTFEEIFNGVGDFIINWGASSGGVLKYKKKFPVCFEEKVWFYKFKREENE